MKRALKVIAYILAAVVVVLGSAALYISMKGVPTYTPGNVTLVAERTPERLARGKQLVALLCQGCHTSPVTQAMTGQRMSDMPPEFGVIFSANITQDRTYGIGGWTDGQLAYFLRTGVLKDGRYVPPVMPKYPNMSDEDMLSVIAFLRSDDRRVLPMAIADTQCQYTFLVKVLTRTFFTPYPYPSAPIPAPDTTNPVAWGKYLVANCGCYSCHSADFTKLDEYTPEKSEGFMGGGNHLFDINGEEVFTPNLTFDRATGIGTWSREDFARALREGFRPDGTVLRAPMPFWRELREPEAGAIYAYLRTLPVISNVKRTQRPAASGGTEGERLYKQLGCNSCHGNDGKGYHPYTAVNLKYPTDSLLILKLKNPFAFEPDSRMPRWNGIIKDSEYPELIAHVRRLAGK